MVDWLAALLPVLVGTVLLWAGAFKLLGRRAPALARRSALTALIGSDRAVHGYRAVGSAELVVGALLVLPPATTVDAALGTALCAGFLGFLGYSRIVAPESSCGCLGDKPVPVRWRSFARAGVLLAASAAALLADGWWGAALADRPVAAAAVLLAGAMIVVALSEEADSYWLLPLRRLRLRLSHPLGRTAAARFEVPVGSSVQQLLRSPAYLAAGGWVRSDLLDNWEEDDWRVLTYGARFGDRAATAVFAVPRTRYEPAEVRAVLVDEDDRTVLWEYQPQPQEPQPAAV